MPSNFGLLLDVISWRLFSSEIKMKSLPMASDSGLHSLDHQEIETISLMQQIKYS